MSKKHSISEDDKEAFNKAMRDVKRIEQTKINPRYRLTPPRTLPQPDEVNSTEFEFSDYEKLEPVGGEDLLTFSRPGIQHKVLRKLRSGQYNIEATLDLHGKTVSAAKQALSQFLQHCLVKGIRHVLIIHGKGLSTNKPILKNKLNHWLRQTDAILAFCSATAKTGRGGALYVLLRRKWN
jgi:DNA-nicking Smr family endonuclease